MIWAGKVKRVINWSQHLLLDLLQEGVFQDVLAVHSFLRLLLYQVVDERHRVLRES
jgi:hypothetical protein